MEGSFKYRGWWFDLWKPNRHLVFMADTLGVFNLQRTLFPSLVHGQRPEELLPDTVLVCHGMWLILTQEGVTGTPLLVPHVEAPCLSAAQEINGPMQGVRG